jgi:hypothetical protein
VKVKADISLAIAIDYTSSMTDDIAAVKEQVMLYENNLVQASS